MITKALSSLINYVNYIRWAYLRGNVVIVIA